MTQSLRSLRAEGSQPHVVVFQEAFSAAAKRIAVDAGYRYVANGPSRDARGVSAETTADRAFDAAASPLRGEDDGKWVDSGLRIASDYPILSVSRMPFPAYACAGFDCLANKGVLAVTIAVPGLPTPVAVVATHLNSRAAAGVPFARSFYAYRRQVDAVGQFIRTAVPADVPLVLAGDFNAGMRVDRRGYLVRSAALWRPDHPMGVALDTCLTNNRCERRSPADISFTFQRGRDWQFFSPGRVAGLAVAALSVPFGRDSNGAMLSDHVGYTAHYRLNLTAPARRLAAI